jgi:hypothetical protein
LQLTDTTMSYDARGTAPTAEIRNNPWPPPPVSLRRFIRSGASAAESGGEKDDRLAVHSNARRDFDRMTTASNAGSYHLARLTRNMLSPTRWGCSRSTHFTRHDYTPQIPGGAELPIRQSIDSVPLSDASAGGGQNG